MVNNLGQLLVRGPRSYQFDFETPTPAQIATADQSTVALIEDFDNGEMRALTRLQGFSNHYLYVGRAVDGDLLRLLDQTQATAGFYARLESERGRLLFDFALLYLAFAMILILGATCVGLVFAHRLSEPIGHMIVAAQRVGDGDLGAQITELPGDDEIAMLGRYFNQMTHQLKGQRDRILTTAAMTDRQRRLFESVLSSVTSGVIGLDHKGQVTFINTSARRVLGLQGGTDNKPLPQVIPEFAPLFQSLKQSVVDIAEAEVKLLRGGKQESLLVRIAARLNENGVSEGYVIAFEDVTALVTAQRMAAWGDVARRIAHEVKNPLTPIKLSAERIQRKFSSRLGDGAAELGAMTAVIVRQTDDLRRIVDDFSKFARLPQAKRSVLDLRDVVRDAVTLQESGQPHVSLHYSAPDAPVMAFVDATLIGQALNNLMKNAGEAIAMRAASQPDVSGKIEVALTMTHRRITIAITDNGIGLPMDRERLFEPYVSHRDGGTGLGLPIVMKIAEEHGGTLALHDAPSPSGTRAVFSLPVAQGTEEQKQISGAAHG